MKYQYGRWLNLSVPVDIALELASTCNMACTYCYHGDGRNLPFERGFMDFKLATEIIGQAASIGVSSLKFNYRGEGTLHPHYSAITRYAQSLAEGGVFIDRLANSNFKIPARRREDVFPGLASLTKVKVSYDSFRKDVFEKQRAGGDHALTTENIDLFYNYPARIKSDTQIVIQAVRTQQNVDEDIEAAVRKRWPSATVSIRDVVGGRLDKDITSLQVKERDVDSRIPCQQAFVRLIVHHDGRVGPCCPSIKNDLLLGNLKHQTVRQVFNGALAKRLRRDLISGKAFDSNPCKGCSSFESYKGYKAKWGS